jgi:GT2 family glycosyltransferase
MIPVLGIPVLNRGDLLLRCIRSIDYPADRLVIVNNGDDPSVAAILDQLQMTGDLPLAIFKPLHNLGCAGSWNWIMRNYPEAAYWLFVGNDIQLAPGDLAKMDAFIRAHPDYVTCPANWGHSLFAITQAGIDRIGYFDGNFWPAYSEDQDHMYRVKLAGAPWADVPDVRAIHGEPPLWGSSTIWSDNALRMRCEVTQRNNALYYKSKWGGSPGQEVFTHPYDDPSLSLKDWHWDADLAKANESPNQPSLT